MQIRLATKNAFWFENGSGKNLRMLTSFVYSLFSESVVQIQTEINTQQQNEVLWYSTAALSSSEVTASSPYVTFRTLRAEDTSKQLQLFAGSNRGVAVQSTGMLRPKNQSGFSTAEAAATSGVVLLDGGSLVARNVIEGKGKASQKGSPTGAT